MDNIAEQIYECLPQDGSTMSGGQIREQLGLAKKDFDKAKAELKGAGSIETGRGRGGTLRIVGAKPQEKQTISKEERAAFAREARQAQTQIQRQRDKIRSKVEDWASNHFEDFEVQVWSHDRCYIYVWNDGIAKTYGVEIVDGKINAI